MERRQLALGARTAAVLTALAVGAGYGYVAADSGWTADEHVHLAAAATVLGITLTAVIVGLRRPGRPLATSLFAAVAVAQLVSYAIIGNPDNHGGQAGFFDVANLLFVLPPALASWTSWRHRRTVVTGGERPVGWTLRALVLFATVPLLWTVVDQALVQRNSWPPASDPHHQGHWHTTSITWMLILTIAAIASRGVDGWPRLATVAAAGASVLGLAGLVFSSDASSPGTAASLAVILWAAAVAWSATVRRSDERVTPPTPTPAVSSHGDG